MLDYALDGKQLREYFSDLEAGVIQEFIGYLAGIYFLSWLEVLIIVSFPARRSSVRYEPRLLPGLDVRQCLSILIREF